MLNQFINGIDEQIEAIGALREDARLRAQIHLREHPLQIPEMEVGQGIPIPVPVEPDINFIRARQVGIINAVQNDEADYAYINPYNYVERPKKPLSKKDELESNYVRIDLDEAAKKLAALLHKDESSEGFLETYDIYYDILFKCKK